MNQPKPSDAFADIQSEYKAHDRPKFSDFVLQGEPPLSAEQQSVYDTVMEGHNVFITGSAGTGKSLLLKYIQAGLEEKRLKYEVTASTGMAAVQVGGRTIHSWAGIKTGDQGLEAMIRKVLTSETANRWQFIDVLVIDEISMVKFPSG